MKGETTDDLIESISGRSFIFSSEQVKEILKRHESAIKELQKKKK